MSVPISALQRNAAAVIRQVAASGIAQEVTDRGRVVAVLSPPPEARGLEKLRASGAVRPGNPALLAEALDMAHASRVDGLMEALEEQRDTDR